MEIKRVNGKKGNKIELVNESWSTSRNWGHKTNVIVNGYDYGEYKVKYYNRTWEMYHFQSCMRGAIAKVMRYNITRYLENYKYTNNITRFKKGQREELIKEYKESNDLMLDLEQTIQAINEGNFD